MFGDQVYSLHGTDRIFNEGTGRESDNSTYNK